MGDGDTSSAKATESGLNTLRPLSLKVCQRVHGGGRPSKSTIMAFNAFHLRREKRLRLHVLRPASQLHNVSIYGHRMPHKSAEVGEVAQRGVKRPKAWNDPRRQRLSWPRRVSCTGAHKENGWNMWKRSQWVVMRTLCRASWCQKCEQHCLKYKLPSLGQNN